MTESIRSDQPLVVLEGASRTYGKGANAVVAVHGASATVRQGDRIALSGRSGSGKSTLLLMMSGLEPATGGDIRWPSFDGNPAGRPRLAGVVFQGPSLIPTLTVEHNVALPLLIDGVDEDAAHERARMSLDQVDLGWTADRLPGELSGGQAQRVAVARVLASGPTLLLADEPSAQLDRATARRVMDALIRAADVLGAALIVSSHDPAIVDRFPMQWTMKDGALADPVTVNG